MTSWPEWMSSACQRENDLRGYWNKWPSVQFCLDSSWFLTSFNFSPSHFVFPWFKSWLKFEFESFMFNPQSNAVLLHLLSLLCALLQSLEWLDFGNWLDDYSYHSLLMQSSLWDSLVNLSFQDVSSRPISHAPAIRAVSWPLWSSYVLRPWSSLFSHGS